MLLMVFKVWFEDPFGLWEPYRAVYQVRTILIIIQTCYSPFSLSFCHKCTMEFSRSFLICDDIITLKANGMWAFVVLCLKVLFLVSNVANMNSYSPYKQQIFGVLNNFLKCIGALWTEYLRTAGLTWSLFIFGHM